MYHRDNPISSPNLSACLNANSAYSFLHGFPARADASDRSSSCARILGYGVELDLVPVGHGTSTLRKTVLIDPELAER
jgi:hypothetical protein